MCVNFCLLKIVKFSIYEINNLVGDDVFAKVCNMTTLWCFSIRGNCCTRQILIKTKTVHKQQKNMKG